MKYFDYLNIKKLEDNIINFISYLIEVEDYTYESALKESKLYY